MKWVPYSSIALILPIQQCGERTWNSAVELSEITISASEVTLYRTTNKQQTEKKINEKGPLRR